jgi:hypothetical protein
VADYPGGLEEFMVENALDKNNKSGTSNTFLRKFIQS